MSDLTLTIDDDVLHRARRRALDESTSVNAVVRDFLERFARDDEAVALERLGVLARRSSASSGGDGRGWTRDELHDPFLAGDAS